MRFFIFFIILIPFLLLHSCSNPPLQKKKTDVLTLAIITNEKEIIPFWNYFEEYKKIKIEPIYLTVDEFIKESSIQGYNSKVDLIYIPSAKVLNELNARKLLQPLFGFEQRKKKGHIKYNKWMLLGYDPFILYKDSTSSTYSDLKKGSQWKTNFSKEEEVSFFKYAQIHFNDTAKYNKWSTEIIANKYTSRSNDSLYPHGGATKTLGLFSKSKQDITFPNQDGIGMFYDFTSLGIYPHSSNFEAAESFILWMVNKKHNTEICKRLKLIPLNYKSVPEYSNLIFHRMSPEQVLKQLKTIKKTNKFN